VKNISGKKSAELLPTIIELLIAIAFAIGFLIRNFAATVFFYSITIPNLIWIRVNQPRQVPLTIEILTDVTIAFVILSQKWKKKGLAVSPTPPQRIGVTPPHSSFGNGEGRMTLRSRRLHTGVG